MALLAFTRLSELAALHRLSVHDAAYLELAQRRKLALACKDGPLRQAARRAVMRTTITVDDRLLGQLKRRAAETGTSVSRLIEQAIRLLIRTPPASKRDERFELVTFGRGGRFSRQNIDKTSSLIEADDVARFAERG